MMRRRMRRRMGNSMVGNMINMGMGNIVGAGLIGASASAANLIPAGTAKTLAGTAVGMQSVALLGHNVGYVKKALPSKKRGYF
jgi:hypothetical protein